MTNTKRGLLARAIALALGMVLATSGSAVAGFCCPSVKTISLQPLAGAPLPAVAATRAATAAPATPSSAETVG